MGCGCSRQLKDMRSDIATMAHANEADHATPSRSDISAVTERIERSKAHWSTLTDHSGLTDAEKVDFGVSNKQEFLDLQSNPIWGGFFGNFNGDGISTGLNVGDLGELVIGRKFAEGGQAELYEAQVKWIDPWNTENDRIFGYEYVLKVFKEGTLLKHVKSQLPQGLLLHHVKFQENLMSQPQLPVLVCKVYRGILLQDGRFAFLMRKEDFDLRTMIERNMKLRSGEDCGPVSKEEGEHIMYEVALGVQWLHKRAIVHRDLKASNVLVSEFRSGWPKSNCIVADYECSIGVIGTGFFRAPEILQACKDHKVKERPEVFSRAADVYSYGMICYEILTGKLPFEDHPLRNRCSSLIDLIINGDLRPEVPKYVDDWVYKLLNGCWQFDPSARPTIEEVLDVLLAKSKEARKYENLMTKRYGENYKIDLFGF